MGDAGFKEQWQWVEFDMQSAARTVVFVVNGELNTTEGWRTAKASARTRKSEEGCMVIEVITVMVEEGERSGEE